MKKLTEFVGGVVSAWGPTISILVTVVLCTFAIWGEMKRIEVRIDLQGARTDKLYEMFIDLLKEGRK